MQRGVLHVCSSAPFGPGLLGTFNIAHATHTASLRVLKDIIASRLDFVVEAEDHNTVLSAGGGSWCVICALVVGNITAWRWRRPCFQGQLGVHAVQRAAAAL